MNLRDLIIEQADNGGYPALSVVEKGVISKILGAFSNKSDLLKWLEKELASAPKIEPDEKPASTRGNVKSTVITARGSGSTNPSE